MFQGIKYICNSNLVILDQIGDELSCGNDAVKIKGHSVRTLQWRHNGWKGLSNHQRLYCLLIGTHSGTDQRKHQSSASPAFVRGIHRWLVNSPHKGQVTQKNFHLMHHHNVRMVALHWLELGPTNLNWMWILMTFSAKQFFVKYDYDL